MRVWIAAALALGLAGPVWADTVELSEDQAAVVGCVEALGETTTWGQCLGVMFKDCAEEEVGSDGHVACLSELHAGWNGAMDNARTGLMPKLTPTGSGELEQLVEQWIKFVARKCADVALHKEGSFAEAAQLGCEISEMAGATAEYVACHAGVSTAPYCDIQE